VVLDPKGAVFKARNILKAVRGVLLLGKSLGCKDPLVRFGMTPRPAAIRAAIHRMRAHPAARSDFG